MIFAKKLGFVLLLMALHILGLAAILKAESTAKAAEPPLATPEQMAAKDAAVTQCTMAQNVPVMGFNLKVVCLEPSGRIAWIR